MSEDRRRFALTARLNDEIDNLKQGLEVFVLEGIYKRNRIAEWRGTSNRRFKTLGPM